MDQPLLQREERERQSGCCSSRRLKAWLPILSWLPKYKLKWLQMDLLAGVTVGLTTVPQALAYAEVAGLPVQNILGLQDIPHEFFPQVYYTFYKIPEARIGDVVLGLLCVALLIMLTSMKTSLEPDDDDCDDAPRFPRAARRFVWAVATMRNALVVVAASFCAFSCEASGLHVFSITGKTTQGLPPFRPPPTSDTTANGTVVTFGEIVEGFGGGLAVIPFMGLLESIAIAKAFAKQNNYRIDTNQELLAIGMTNVMGSFVSAYPVTGSFGRTAVNSQTGVCTPAGGIVTSGIVLLSLAFLMPAFYYIPKASLAAVVICAVTPMVDYRVVAKIWKIHKLDLLPFIMTFLLSFWRVQYGIIGGVAISGALLMYTMARPGIKMSNQGVMLIELASGLSFPAAEHLSHIIHTQALQDSPPRSVVLDCSHVSVIDYTVINELSDLLGQFKRQDVHLILSGLQPNVLKILLAADLEGLRYADGVETALQMGSGNLNL
ncbi:sodium-independent sulfate anion transporter isoform X2 [Hippocampus comes]|uniref:sodium-independent sulfate anion transporter isoform X2 n=1 Tax=Hippocampus comes TaxID=109280 RepID=UPI00094E099B|nr:PREDICTED: sodium-independent sulfate anion transporter isoform X2 [Hippocampus comes]